MLVVLALGCIDYLFGEEPSPLLPDLVVRLLPVEDGVCAEGAVDVELANAGEAVLTVSGLEVEGRDWAVVEAALPLEIEPGAARRVALRAAGGEATLVVHSDDPNAPESRLALAAVTNLGPVVTLVSPFEEQAVAEGADLTLTAFVADADDAVESLALTWVSNPAGPVGSAIADADGRVEWVWPAADRPSGPQVIALQAADACGAVGEASVFFCQDGPWAISPLIDEAWHYEGAAALDDGVLTLTPDTPDSVGAAFDLVSIFEGDRVQVAFSFQAEGGSGGEGFSLTLLDADRREGFVGGGGCGLGFGGGAACTEGPALPGWSLAIDTHDDPGDCAAGPHLAFTVDGDLSTVGPCVAVPTVADGAWHDLSVTMEAATLRVVLDGVEVLAEPVAGIPSFQAYLGFTASTTSWRSAHRIRDVVAVDSTCE